MKFTGRYKFRLVIALPLFVICFTLAAGFYPLGKLDAMPLSFEVHSAILSLKVAVLFISVVAAMLAVMISRYIVKPIETIIKQMEELSGQPEREAAGSELRMDDEIDRLSKLYQQTLVPMKGYLTTADLFLQMSEGIISLNADGKIAFLNAPVERLFDIDRRKYTGTHYDELFPNAARNCEI